MSYEKVRKQMIQEMLDEYGYIFCQKSGVSNARSFHVHHIVFRSEKPKHPQLNNKRNLIIVSDDEHDEAHKEKHPWRAKLIEERNLTELFGNDILPLRHRDE